MDLNEVVVKVERSKTDNGQDQSTANVITEKQHEVRTSKGHILTKYVGLFSFILVAVVLSTIIANHVSTENIKKDIDNKQVIWMTPQWNILDILQSNLTETKIALQLVIKNETKKASELVLQRFMNETDIKNEIMDASELVLQRFLNETDFLSWKKDTRKFYTMIYLMVCVNNCTGRNDGDYQSCYTCEGFVSCSLGILFNRTCMFSGDNRRVHWDDINKRCEYNSNTCNPDYLPIL